MRTLINVPAGEQIFLFWRITITGSGRLVRTKLKIKDRKAQLSIAMECKSTTKSCCVASLCSSNFLRAGSRLGFKLLLQKEKPFTLFLFLVWWWFSFLGGRAVEVQKTWKQAWKKTSQNEMQKCSFCGWIRLQKVKHSPVLLWFLFAWEINSSHFKRAD